MIKLQFLFWILDLKTGGKAAVRTSNFTYKNPNLYTQTLF